MQAMMATHPATNEPLVNPAIATAAIAAYLGAPGPELALPELALIVEAEAATLAALPATATIGYAVIADTGQILPPGATLPPGTLLFASVRIPLPPGNAPNTVQDTLAHLAGSGWRFTLQPRLAMALDRSIVALRARPTDLARPGTTGAGVLLGAVDFGCDFAHPAFRTETGATRLEFLWDQNAPNTCANTCANPGPIPGKFHTKAAIDAALATPDPYAALGYRPDANTYAPALNAPAPNSPGLNSNALNPQAPNHGTHVLGTAAGRGVEGCPPGAAPAATLGFVHLRPGALVSNGDPADVFDGVCALFAHADTLQVPAVVNLSLGANTGSHDGNTLYDRALDAILAAPGRAIAVAAGNEREARLNTDGIVTAETPTTLFWCFAAGDPTANTLRIFCDAPGPGLPLQCTIRLADTEAELTPPTPPITRPFDPGANAQPIQRGTATIGVLYSGLATTCDPVPLQHIELRMVPSGRPELVEVTLTTNSPTPIPFDAWIDRDDRAAASQSSFAAPLPITRSTLSSTACGRRTTCVGAFDHGAPALPPTPFSAEGATRDNRFKPDVSAPGIQVLAAAAYGGRTPPGSAWPNAAATRMSGTSVAAPHVAGVLALMLQLNPTLHATEATAILRRTARNTSGAWHPQLGDGRVDAAAAVQAAALPLAAVQAAALPEQSP